MNPSPNNNGEITRREFLGRTVKAGVSIAAAGGLSYWTYQRAGLPLPRQDASSVSLADYSVSGTAGLMSIANGSDRAKTLGRCLKALGGIETFIAKGDRVLLKVNAGFATPAMVSATSHPEVVAEMVRLSLAAGADSVSVTDNPINDPKSSFELNGIAPAVRKAGGKILLPRESYFKPTSVPGGKLIRNWPILYEPFRKTDKVIGIAQLKQHFRSGATMTMKNWYGLLGGTRNRLHQEIHVSIKELAMMVKPTLVILDATTAMIANGPTGGSLDDLKQTNTMIVSTDQVAADAFGATLLELSSTDLPYIGMAAAAGAGTDDYQSLNPIRIDAS